MVKKYFPFYLLLFVVVVLPIIIDAALKNLWPNFYWEHEPFHSSVEAMGSVIAIFMALILFLKQKEDTRGSSYLLSLGFLSMGLFDGFHAIAKPGNTFVFFHSIASFIGSFWFALTWFPNFGRSISKNNSTSWIVISGILICGIGVYVVPETLPSMIRSGKFTAAAIAINIIAGIMFLLAALKFSLEYLKVKTIETSMFACMTLLFGVAEITFYQSSIWDGGWWFWHLLRLLSYILVMLFIIQQYIKITALHKESEDRYRGVVEDTPVLICCFGSDNKITFINDAYCNFFGKSSDELVGSSFLSLVPEIDKKFVKDNIATLNPEFTEQSHEHRSVSSKGEYRWLRWTNRGLFDTHGHLLGYQSIGLDITERKKLETSLKENESFLKTIYDNSNIGIFVVKVNGIGNYIFEGVNKTHEDLFSIKNDFIVGKSPKDLNSIYNAEAINFIYELYDGCVKTKSSHTSEHQLLMPNGEKEWWLSRVIPLLDENEEPYRLIGTAVNITERIRSEQKLRLQGNVLDQINDHVTITDLDGAITYVNQAQERAMGFITEEVVGQMTDIYGEDSKRGATQKKILESTFKNGAWRGEVVNKTKDGYEVIMDCRTKVIHNKDDEPICMVEIGTDITERIKAEKEREKLESQLQQAQKMESIGTLAGGIAHDFNNILYPIIGFTEMSIEDLPENHPIQENLGDVLQGAKRARNLVQQILSFSKQRDLDQKVLPLQPLIEETLRLMRSIIPSNIEIQKDIVEEQICVFANTTEIHEVIMNLSTNAYHAMEENGGILKVSLKKEQPGEAYNLPSGEYCCLGIRDTGSGISPVIIDDIFNPYFTTKEQGKGSGLGLSVIHGIIKNYKGTVDVQSKLDKGTMVKVYLPLISKECSMDNDPAPQTIPTGNERILFVDDEASIVKLGARLLQRLGYTVTGETSSKEALRLFNSKPNNFDLVITDMTMPLLLGTDLAKKILEVRKDIPILLCTGFSERVDNKIVQSLGIKGYINKPILQDELAAKVRELLDKSKEE